MSGAVARKPLEEFRREGVNQRKRKENGGDDFHGRSFCVGCLLSPVCHTRDCLAVAIGQSLKGEDVAESLNRICAQRGVLKTIKADNGSDRLLDGEHGSLV
jgi:hypothetical protein